MVRIWGFATAVAALGVFGLSVGQEQTYTNPAIPGWHSDPSCVQVDGTYLCVTSTFIAFPGLPIYASKDLVNWRHASNVWNRDSQMAGISWETEGQQEGMFAATLRYREGTYYVICEYLGPRGLYGVLFKSTDPFSSDSWSDPVTFSPSYIDPDLFWDDDGTVWMAIAGNTIRTIDLDTGDLGEEHPIWEGTGGASPEGPHIYKRDDGYYYLLIAEGGTFGNHAVTMARSTNITGPYEPYENNPVLTNRDTDQYFQYIGHADLFQDPDGNWWGLCLGVRISAMDSIPMGRESMMFNVTWNEGEYPEMQPIRGRMPGDLLPEQNLDVRGEGPFVEDDDEFEFRSDSSVPAHFLYWRIPRNDSFSMTDQGLRINPTRNNLTGIPLSTDEIELSGQRGLAFIGRRQTHTLFDFNVDVSFAPEQVNQETGVSVFRTQVDHIDLGIVRKESGLHFRFRAVGPTDLPEPQEVPVPEEWQDGPFQLRVAARNESHYELSAARPDAPGEGILVGTAAAEIVSGGNGTFVGSLVGAYATCNGEGSGVTCPDGGAAVISKWVYRGISQQIDHDTFTPEM